MEYFFLGIAYIPLSIVGSILNVYGLYSLLKFIQKKNHLEFGNFERLILALNISDSLTCSIGLPMKIILFMLNTTTLRKVKYVYSIDVICQLASLLLLTGISFNNYVKITKSPTKYGSMLTKRKINAFIVAVYIFSSLIFILMVVDIKVTTCVVICVFLISSAVMIKSYVAIVKELKRSKWKMKRGKETIAEKKKLAQQNSIWLSCH